MKEEHKDAETQQALFAGLVFMLASSAMQHMGRIAEPGADKPEVDLQAAEATIDLLSMLEVKTKGNLSADEARLVKETLSTLQMTFVQATSEKGKTATPPPSAPSASAACGEPDRTAASPTDPPPPAAPRGKPDSQEPRYHKSYG